MEKSILSSTDSLGLTNLSYHIKFQIFKDLLPVDKTAAVAINYFQAATDVESRLKQRLIEKAGVSYLTTTCDSLEDLRARIEDHGSAIATINSIGGHVILVDEITDKSVRIHDRYHGWEVDIKRSAFDTTWSKASTVFQVA